MKAMIPTQYGMYKESDVSGTLRASCGDSGGQRVPCLYTDIVGTLCARDYKGISSEYAAEGKIIVEFVRSDS